jgi:hypothetical protein
LFNLKIEIQMKARNILLVVLFSLLTMFASGQDKTATISDPATYASFSFTAADTVSNYDTIYWVQINGYQTEPATQAYTITLDSVSGSPYCSLQLQGRIFSGSSWTNIGSAKVWHGTASDTTIVFTNATANRYRQYKLNLDATATAQKFKVTALEFKVWRE